VPLARKNGFCAASVTFRGKRLKVSAKSGGGLKLKKRSDFSLRFFMVSLSMNFLAITSSNKKACPLELTEKELTERQAKQYNILYTATIKHNNTNTY
jgi:hypothetical protein